MIESFNCVRRVGLRNLGKVVGQVRIVGQFVGAGSVDRSSVMGRVVGAVSVDRVHVGRVLKNKIFALVFLQVANGMSSVSDSSKQFTSI